MAPGHGKRGWRCLRRVLLVLLGVPLLAAAVFLLLAPLRERVLDAVFPLVDGALPGTFAVESARWPAPDRLLLVGVRWTDGPRELLALDTLEVAVHPGPLFGRTLHLDTIRAIGLRADVPAVRAAFPAPADTVAATEGAPEFGFLHPGSLPGLPSIGVDRMEIRGGSIVLSDSLRLDLPLLRAGMDLRAGEGPGVRVDTVGARFGDVGAIRGAGAVGVEPWRAEGGFAGRYRTEPFTLEIDSPAEDRLRIHAVSAPGAADRGAAAVTVSLHLDRKKTDVGGFDYAVDLDTEGTRTLARWAPLADRLERLPPLDSLAVNATGTIRLQPGREGTIRLRIPPTGWIEGMSLDAVFDPSSVTIDTLALGVSGLRVRGGGTISESARLSYRIVSQGDGWLDLLDSPPVDSVRFVLTGAVRGSPRAPQLEGELEGRLLTETLALERVRARFRGDPGEDLRIGVAVSAESLVAVGSFTLTMDEKPLLRAWPVSVFAGDRAPWPDPDRRPQGDPSWTVATAPVRVDADGVLVTGALGTLRAHGAFAPRTGGSLVAAWRVEPAVAAGFSDAAGTALDSLGPFVAGFRASVERSVSGYSGSAAANLEETAWIDTGRVAARWDGRGAILDTLAVVLPGLRLHGGGRYTNAAANLEARIEVDDALLATFADVSPRPSFAVAGSLLTSGTRDSLAAAARLSGHGGWREFTVPRIDLAAHLNPGLRRVTISAPGGVRVPDAALDSLSVTYRSRGGPLARIEIDAAGPDMDLVSRFDLDTTADSIVVHADSLHVIVAGMDLAARRPFRLALDRRGRAFRIEALQMQGGLGELGMDGHAGPGGSSLEAHADLRLPARAPRVVPAVLWPERVRFEASARGRHSLEARLEIDGLRYEDRTDGNARISASGDSLRLSLEADLKGGDEDILGARLELPVAASVHPFGFTPTSGPVLIDLQFTDTPVRLPRDLIKLDTARRPLRVNGSLFAEGRADSLEGGGSFRITFDDWPRLHEYTMHVQTWLTPAAGRASVPDSLGLVDTLRTELGDRRLLAAFALERETRFGGGYARVPVDVSLDPVRLGLRSGEALEFEIESRNLDLADLNPLFPPDVDVSGRLGVHVAGDGPVNDIRLDGRIEARNVAVSTADDSRIVFDALLDAGGRRDSSLVTGTVTIQQGTLRIPEPPRELLPSTGRSLLWESRWERADTLGVDTLGTSIRIEAEEPVPVLGGVEVDVTLDVPAALWVKGRGLEVELQGEVRVRTVGGALSVDGRLRAVRGQLITFGRRFELVRGSAVFSGGELTSPELDLVLSHTLSSGTEVRILFRGTVTDPTVTLESSPEMTEGDIMAGLVFGRPLDELNSAQTSRLAQEAATSIAAARLQSALSGELGLDILRHEQDQDRGDRLVVGKYLSRRVLVKYEQLLDDIQNFFVNLEYLLTGNLKLETLVGSRKEAGILLNWTRDY